MRRWRNIAIAPTIINRVATLRFGILHPFFGALLEAYFA
jgi:hypothetical protein